MEETGTVIAQFKKNSREEVRVSIDEFKGRTIINLRVLYKENDKWLPGKQGLALSIDRYHDLADAVVKMGEELRSRGLLIGRPDSD